MIKTEYKTRATITNPSGHKVRCLQCKKTLWVSEKIRWISGKDYPIAELKCSDCGTLRKA